MNPLASQMDAAQPQALHPLFAGILAAHAAVPAAAQRTEYIALLRCMDWTAEHSDDCSKAQQLRRDMKRVRSLQPYVDPDRALFNAHRPDEHGVPTL
jgi:hypothetical protein